jgi:hypothetical protein
LYDSVTLYLETVKVSFRSIVVQPGAGHRSALWFLQEEASGSSSLILASYYLLHKIRLLLFLIVGLLPMLTPSSIWPCYCRRLVIVDPLFRPKIAVTLSSIILSLYHTIATIIYHLYHTIALSYIVFVMLSCYRISYYYHSIISCHNLQVFSSRLYCTHTRCRSFS